MNTKMQGDIGVGKAIAYFLSKGIAVSYPLTDTKRYDLIVDIKSKLHRVQVKTTKHKRNYFEVEIRTLGGNQSFSTVKKFDPSAVDLLFIWCTDGTQYLIPTIELVARSKITLSPKYKKYLVG